MRALPYQVHFDLRPSTQVNEAELLGWRAGGNMMARSDNDRGAYEWWFDSTRCEGKACTVQAGQVLLNLFPCLMASWSLVAILHNLHIARCSSSCYSMLYTVRRDVT